LAGEEERAPPQKQPRVSVPSPEGTKGKPTAPIQGKRRGGEKIPVNCSPKVPPPKTFSREGGKESGQGKAIPPLFFSEKKGNIF